MEITLCLYVISELVVVHCWKISVYLFALLPWDGAVKGPCLTPASFLVPFEGTHYLY